MPFDDADSLDVSSSDRATFFGLVRASNSDRATYFGLVRASFGVARMYK
jgi:hypothetical protein